jgi:hypothetical protein
MPNARESMLWHRLIVREMATMDQLNAAVALMEKEPALELGPALIRMGIVTAAQVADLDAPTGKVTVRCRACRHEQEVNARLLKSGVRCPKCQAPMELRDASPPAPVPLEVPAPSHPVDLQLVLILAAIVCLFLLAAAIALMSSKDVRVK